MAHESIEILELQLIGNALRDEALKRYVADPNRLQAIRDVYRDAFAVLVAIPPSVTPVRCPPGWWHKNCACEPNVITPPPSPPPTSG